jgi:hypothetical protein
MRQGISQDGAIFRRNIRIWGIKGKNRAQYAIYPNLPIVGSNHRRHIRSEETLGPYQGLEQFHTKRVWDSYRLGNTLFFRLFSATYLELVKNKAIQARIIGIRPSGPRTQATDRVPWATPCIFTFSI